MNFSDLLAAVPNLVTAPEKDAVITAPVSERADRGAGRVFLARRGASVDNTT